MQIQRQTRDCASMDESSISELINVKIGCDMSYGRYIWCGNMNAPPNSGFFLNIHEDVRDQYGDPETNFMTLTVKMGPWLAKIINTIELYDHTGFLFGYNVKPIRDGCYCFYKKLDRDLIGTTLTIKLGNYDFEGVRGYQRPKLNTIRSYNMKIEDVVTKSDNICCICLEEVAGLKDKYIGPCGHSLHMKCLWKYLESGDKLYPQDELQCMDIYPNGEAACCHSRKYKPFKCPLCGYLIFR